MFKWVWYSIPTIKINQTYQSRIILSKKVYIEVDIGENKAKKYLLCIFYIIISMEYT